MNYMADFLIYCRLELGLSSQTITNYQFDLQHLSEACQSLQCEAHACGPDEVARVLAWLRDHRQHSGTTLARHLVAWRMYQRYLVMEGIIDRDRVQLARSPRLWLTLPDVLSVDEVTRLLLSPAEGEMYWRDRCALELLYASGARASETIGVGLADIKQGGALVQLLGKGNKQRLVPFGKTSSSCVAAISRAKSSRPCSACWRPATSWGLFAIKLSWKSHEPSSAVGHGQANW